MAGGEMIAVLKDWRRKFFSGVEAVVFVLVLVLLVLIALQVFTRYIMHAALPWTEEVARMMLVWMVILGAAIAMERKEHYAITVLSDRFRGATLLWVLVITNLLGVVFLAALAYHGAEYMSANMKTTYVSTQVSRGWVYLALPVGSVIMIASLALHSVEVWNRRDDASTAAQHASVIDV
jgi:TRAP-type C4-dicarboxylate transport system permease small subunit